MARRAERCGPRAGGGSRPRAVDRRDARRRPGGQDQILGHDLVVVIAGAGASGHAPVAQDHRIQRADPRHAEPGGELTPRGVQATGQCDGCQRITLGHGGDAIPAIGVAQHAQDGKGLVQAGLVQRVEGGEGFCQAVVRQRTETVIEPLRHTGMRAVKAFGQLEHGVRPHPERRGQNVQGDDPGQEAPLGGETLGVQRSEFGGVHGRSMLEAPAWRQSIDTPPGWRPTDRHASGLAPYGQTRLRAGALRTDTPPGWRPTDSGLRDRSNSNQSRAIHVWRQPWAVSSMVRSGASPGSMVSRTPSQSRRLSSQKPVSR